MRYAYCERLRNFSHIFGDQRQLGYSVRQAELTFIRFFRYLKKYSGYPKKNLRYLKYWHIKFIYLKKNFRYQK